MLLSFPLLAQQPAIEDYCATDHLSAEQEAFLQDFRQHPDRFAEGERSTRYVPVQVHIVGQDNGSGYYPVEDVLRNMCEVNDWYKDANIHFYIKDPINYIDKSVYFNHSGAQGRSMMNIYNVPNRLNWYIVNDPAGTCGYFSPFGDAVALRKSCLGPGNTTLAHEFGHFLSLPHTFNGWEGGRPPTQFIERADGSNCQTAGDGFCDTPADYLADRWTCPYNGNVLIDPVGDTVIPDGTQIMSYSNDACQTSFSNSQNNAMRAFIATNRSNLVNQGSPATIPATQSPNLISPTDNAAAIPANQVTLEWQSLPSANLYHVEVSRISAFALHEFNNVTTSTSITVPDLLPGRTYYWRVTAMNTGNTCTRLSSGTFSFATTEPTGIGPTEVLKGVKVYPNPAQQGAPLLVDLSTYPLLDGAMQLYSMDGRLVHQEVIGGNYLSIPTGKLAQGVYQLRITSVEGQYTQRVVIQ